MQLLYFPASTSKLSRLRLPTPPPVLIGLPIGDLRTHGFGRAPARPRRVQSIRIVAIKKQDDALITGRLSGQTCAIDEKADLGAVRIVLVNRQHDRLLGRLGVAPRSVRQKSVVAPRPQMGVERFDTLLGRRLHDNTPAALKRLLKKRRQNLFRRLPFEMVEKDFGHSPVTARNSLRRAVPKSARPNRTPSSC